MENSTLDNASSLCERATDPGSGTFCDARNGLHYMLLRLSVAGLTTDEQEQLLELGARTFSGGDADNVASKIISNQQASPLAVAIASIVQKSRLSKKMSMLGSVFGAYSALGEPTPEHCILAAAAGAVALSTSEFLQQHVFEAQNAQSFTAKREV
jgi:hypothetical protein